MKRGIRIAAIMATLATASFSRSAVLTFIEGENGYSGAADLELAGGGGLSGFNLGAEVSMSVDLSNGGGESHGLMRFNNIIGGGVNQIPAGAIIASAKLRVYIDSVGNALKVHRMLQPWNENVDTFDSWVGGIQANGIEAAVVPTSDSGLFVTPAGAFWEFELGADVQAWANGETNNGWAFLPTGTNGVDWFTKENIDPLVRPQLVVEFQAGSTKVIPGDFNIVSGTLFGGSLASLANSDDDSLFILNDENDPNATLLAFGSGATQPNTSAKVKYETGATRTDLSIFVDTYVYGSTNAYVNRGTATSTLADTVREVTVSGADLANFVSSTGEVSVRLRWIPQADLEAADGWAESIDQISWSLQ